MVHEKYQRIIEISRKYKLRPDNTLKCEVFILFDQGYSTAEVRLILQYMKDTYDNPKAFTNTIRRYHYDWKKAQLNHA
jgi:hypothetical protein